eukprot:20530-Alexandrium_andersonii.AAC.1
MSCKLSTSIVGCKLATNRKLARVAPLPIRKPIQKHDGHHCDGVLHERCARGYRRPAAHACA